MRPKTTPSSGTVATSRPVRELDRRSSAYVRRKNGPATSTAAKTSSHGQRASIGRSMPRPAAIGTSRSAASAVRPKTTAAGERSSTATLMKR